MNSWPETKSAQLSRRGFCAGAGVLAAGLASAGPSRAAEPFQLNYIVGSSMYGKLPLAEILPEVRKTGARHIDIWPLVHGNQREQIEQMGREKFLAMCAEHGVKVGVLTHYDLGPFKLQPAMDDAVQFGAKIIITGARGPKDATGAELKKAVYRFVEQMKPHVAAAEAHGVTIGIENHSGSLINTPDSIRWFIEAADSPAIGVGLAPYHLPQDEKLIASLIEDLGDRLTLFYAWQHGDGCMVKLPKEQELKQLPGRGPLDFAPLLAALKKIDYAGFTEIFMHPVPRGIPIMPTAAQTTAQINQARAYLEQQLVALG